MRSGVAVWLKADDKCLPEDGRSNSQVRGRVNSLRWFSQRRSPTPHFWGYAPRGLWPPNANSAEIFVQCTYPQVSSFYAYSFVSYRVDKQTNRRHWKHPALFATLRRLGKYVFFVSFWTSIGCTGHSWCNTHSPKIGGLWPSQKSGGPIPQSPWLRRLCIWGRCVACYIDVYYLPSLSNRLGHIDNLLPENNTTWRIHVSFRQSQKIGRNLGTSAVQE